MTLIPERLIYLDILFVSNGSILCHLSLKIDRNVLLSARSRKRKVGDRERQILIKRGEIESGGERRTDMTEEECVGKSEGDREREEWREKEIMTHGDKYSYFRRQIVRKRARGRK